MVAGASNEVAARGRSAVRTLRGLGRPAKDRALEAIAVAITGRSSRILAANARDVAVAHAGEVSGALIDRLTLTPRRVEALAAAARAIASLPDPCGEVVAGGRLANGLEVTKVRVPIGRVLVVYEARPNVTVDVAGLCVKSGNVALLRGSSAARETNAALLEAIHEGLTHAGVIADAVIAVDLSREALARFVADPTNAEVVVPRGGEALKDFLVEHARIPVLAAAGGNCHVYVDAGADVAMAEAIIVNAKTSRPGVCNAAETLLIHEGRIDALPRLVAALVDRGVEVRGCARTVAAAGSVVLAVNEADYETEFLDLVIAVRVVDSITDAVDHIARYSTGHSEAIVTDSVEAAERFIADVDAACVYVNASTRFTDGGEFGMGAEIGNATGRLHVRGPIGLRDLTTTKYVIRGAGQVRW